VHGQQIKSGKTIKIEKYWSNLSGFFGKIWVKTLYLLLLDQIHMVCGILSLRNNLASLSVGVSLLNETENKE